MTRFSYVQISDLSMSFPTLPGSDPPTPLIHPTLPSVQYKRSIRLSPLIRVTSLVARFWGDGKITRERERRGKVNPNIVSMNTLSTEDTFAQPRDWVRVT